MLQRRPLYSCVAGAVCNNILQSDPGSEEWLWGHLLLSSGIDSILFSTVAS